MGRNVGSRLRIKTLATSVMILAATSCGQSTQETSETSIYGGKKTVPGGWPSTVGVLRKNGRIFCSGTAINPRLVITAAHCIPDSANGVTIYVGDGKEGGEVTGQYQAAKVKGSPKWGKGTQAYDIGYITLKTPIDLPASAFTQVLTKSNEVKELIAIGNTGHLVGFGSREGDKYGVKYEVATKITAKNNVEATLGGNGKDACFGDSGGPAYGKLANGEWRVYGVTSRGPDCGSGTIYGLMHASICWLQSDSGINLGLPAGTCP